MSWAEEELATLDLGDKRLNCRAMLLAERLSSSPTASIPAACNDWAETQAAYRLLSHEKADWDKFMEPHWACTEQRMEPHAEVLCLADTTECDYNGREVEGLGPLSYEAQRGMYVHATYAVSTQREPLGVVDAWTWSREFKDEDGQRGGIKESRRWIEGYQRLAEMSERLPQTRLVYVADRESDIADLMCEAHNRGNPVDWLVRSQHNRALPNGDKLWKATASGEPIGTVTFPMPAGRGRKARTVHQTIWVKRVEINDGRGGRIPATCVVARELTPPPKTQAVEWRLITNRVPESFEAVTQLIDWYRARWEVEMFFNILKNGCQVEKLQLTTMERLERALALLMIVAWRINRLMRLGRTCPDLPADLVFELNEWQAAYAMNGKRPPSKPPALNEVVRLIAMAGGFLGRKNDGEPGSKTLWEGLMRVTDCAQGLRMARLAGIS